MNKTGISVCRKRIHIESNDKIFGNLLAFHEKVIIVVSHGGSENGVVCIKYKVYKNSNNIMVLLDWRICGKGSDYNYGRFLAT